MPIEISLSQTEDDSMSALRILPFNVLVRAADTAAAAFVTALIPYLHPRSFPFIHFCWAKYGTNLIGALRHANIMVKHCQMGFRVTLKSQKILFFFNILR